MNYSPVQLAEVTKMINEALADCDLKLEAPCFARIAAVRLA